MKKKVYYLSKFKNHMHKLTKSLYMYTKVYMYVYQKEKNYSLTSTCVNLTTPDSIFNNYYTVKVSICNQINIDIEDKMLLLILNTKLLFFDITTNNLSNKRAGPCPCSWFAHEGYTSLRCHTVFCKLSSPGYMYLPFKAQV